MLVFSLVKNEFPWVYLGYRTVHVKMVKMLNLVVCIFYHNF